MNAVVCDVLPKPSVAIRATPATTLALGLIGPGKVGSALLDQIAAAAPHLRRTRALDLRLRVIVSTKFLLAHAHDLGANWRDRDADIGDNDIDGFLRHLLAARSPHAVILDCSGSDAIAARYPQWLAAGIHVITPNKQAGAGPLDRYRAIRDAAARGNARFRYEATVGAGLPVISTLRDLLDTGDELHGVEGILSGTLAWLFNRYDGSVPFSALVREAHALGYTEPDPRDDLSGTDVARKLVILAREAGLPLTLADVAVENLVPDGLRRADRDGFMQNLHMLDDIMATRLERAQRNGGVLRYVARLDHTGHASVGLVEMERAHAFANIRLTDNIVQFCTRRYCANPLVVRGPGAGPEVTAAGVFADLLRVAQALGARV
jgi:aspartokinase/homoserine dehydrogenase 1